MDSFMLCRTKVLAKKVVHGEHGKIKIFFLGNKTYTKLHFTLKFFQISPEIFYFHHLQLNLRLFEENRETKA